MSREIEFRAWCKTKNKYFKPHSIQFGTDSYSVYRKGAMCADINNKKFGYRVVLEQYTGSKDKNGKKIFEGDIVRLRKKAKGAGLGVVIFSKKASKFAVRITRNGYRKNETHLISIINCEIIGNIHENPQLLEVE